MKVKTSYGVLREALSHVNAEFDNNILLEAEDRGRYFRVRLKVKD